MIRIEFGITTYALRVLWCLDVQPSQPHPASESTGNWLWLLALQGIDTFLYFVCLFIGIITCSGSKTDRKQIHMPLTQVL